MQLPLSSCLQGFVLGALFFFISVHPAFFSSSVKVSFHANNLAIWASSPNADVQLPLSRCLQGFVFGPVLFFINNTLPFFSHPLEFLSMLTIWLFGPPPQTLTCNGHCQAALKVLFLNQSFLFISDHPAFFFLSVKVFFHANDFAIWAFSANVDVQLLWQGAFKLLFFEQSFFFINDHPAFFSSCIKVSFHANDFSVWAFFPNVDVQLPLSSCFRDFVLGPFVFFINDHFAFFSSSVKVCFHANDLAI